MKRSLFTIFIIVSVCIGLSYVLSACKKEQNTKGLTLVGLQVPAGFPAPAYTFQDNPLSKEGIELGRKLFYDERLSKNNAISCASCHHQIAGFGTFEHDLSHGVFNSHTIRNAPVLFNLAWNKGFQWDGAFVSLQDAIAQPITGRVELGETFDDIIKKLKSDDDYKERFRTVFRTNTIKPEYILKVLAQFTGTLTSANSKYDKVKKGETNFNAQEQSGYNIYQQKCATCHPEPLFTDNSYRNIGLPINSFFKDYGRWTVTGNKTDSLKFKVPTLRNTLISSNYMHDGRFATLQQCLNHYRTGVQASTTLDPLLTNGISLTNNEVENLFQFLKALTDSSFITNPNLAKPN
jgi:cytochrome c peroxidase